jgi:hypothetical protein
VAERIALLWNTLRITPNAIAAGPISTAEKAIIECAGKANRENNVISTEAAADKESDL